MEIQSWWCLLPWAYCNHVWQLIVRYRPPLIQGAQDAIIGIEAWTVCCRKRGWLSRSDNILFSSAIGTAVQWYDQTGRFSILRVDWLLLLANLPRLRNNILLLTPPYWIRFSSTSVHARFYYKYGLVGGYYCQRSCSNRGHGAKVLATMSCEFDGLLQNASAAVWSQYGEVPTWRAVETYQYYGSGTKQEILSPPWR